MCIRDRYRGVVNDRIGEGSKIIISMSKIRNRTANRKNRRENGRRALDDGENPHSNGLDSSRSFHGVECVLIIEKNKLRKIGIIIVSVRGFIIVIISYDRSSW